jgi:hypothetical protein
MTRQGLAELWRKRLDECAKSGESVVYWCYLNQVEPHQYYYWKRRLANVSPQPTVPPAFLPVAVVPDAPIPAALTLRIAGAAIDVTPGFDPDTLRAVVVALAGIAC